MNQQDLKANPERVTKASDELLKMIEEYVLENQVTAIDVFMIAHNIHKRLVTECALRWSTTPQGVMKTYQMADQTFRKAMKDLWRTT